MLKILSKCKHAQFFVWSTVTTLRSFFKDSEKYVTVNGPKWHWAIPDGFHYALRHRRHFWNWGWGESWNSCFKKFHKFAIGFHFQLKMSNLEMPKPGVGGGCRMHLWNSGIAHYLRGINPLPSTMEGTSGIGGENNSLKSCLSKTSQLSNILSASNMHGCEPLILVHCSFAPETLLWWGRRISMPLYALNF